MNKPLTLATLSLLTSAASAQVVPSGFRADNVVTGLTQPTVMEFIGPTRFLVCEKTTGRVKHYLNNTLQTISLDLNVANNSERGLLGMCLDPNFAQNNFVYLYYSNAATDGGTWLDNRVEKFVWDGTNLTFSQTLIVFPFDGAQSNGPNHDGGIIMIGPDQKLYIITGDLNRNRLEQNQSSTAIAGVGAVHRINLDGTVPSDNPFFSHSNQMVKTYYAYGVRNSYGLTFDPVTNIIWDTENGPSNYDEINPILPGFNSGWNKLMGPDSRNSLNASDLVYLSGAYYSDPVFSWLSTIAPTALKFIDTYQFGGDEFRNLFVGDANFGNLYLFTMDPSRTAFVYKPGTEDRVADSTAEQNLYRWGSSLGSVTDIEIGPDKFIYIVSLSNGRITRIKPVDVVAAAESYTLIRGALAGGTIASLHGPDDDRLSLRRGVVLTNEAPVSIQTTATASVASTTQLELVVESFSTHTGIPQKVELLNQQTGQFETLINNTTTTSETATSVVVTTNPNRFINSGNRQVVIRASYGPPTASQAGKFVINLDRLFVKVRE